jgi:hypothetical protein
VWASALGERLFVCLLKNELATVDMIHQNVSFTALPSEHFTIYLDSAFMMTGRCLCNV